MVNSILNVYFNTLISVLVTIHLHSGHYATANVLTPEGLNGVTLSPLTLNL